MKPVKKLTLFITLTLLNSLLMWGSLVLFKLPVSNLETGYVGTPLAMGLYILNGFMPSIIGLILIIRTEREQRRVILATLLPKREQLPILRQILIIFLSCFVVQVIIYEIVIGGFEYRTVFANIYQVIPLIILGPLSEEIGWRGYMQMQVSKLTTPLKGTLLIAIVWALWHLPLFYILGTTQQVNNVNFFTFSILIVLVSWVMTYYYEATKGNLFVSVFIHWIYTVVLSFYVLSTTYSVLSDVLSILPYIVVSCILLIRIQKKRKVVTMAHTK